MSFRDNIADEVIKLIETGQIGGSFWRSTTILGAGLVDATTLYITAVSARGDLIVEDIILKTDGVGLAGGTTLQIVCDNEKGTSIIMEEPITRLGGRRTVDMDASRLRVAAEHLHESLSDSAVGALGSALMTASQTILEEGKRIGVKQSGSNTGDGHIDIYIKFQRLAAYADVKSA